MSCGPSMVECRGVMHPSSLDMKSWATVEEFLRAYEAQSLKNGSSLINCPKIENQPWSRCLTDEVLRLLSDCGAKWRGEESPDPEELDHLACDFEPCSPEGTRPKAERAPQQSPRKVLPDLSPSVIGCVLCTFSVGLALGRRGW